MALETQFVNVTGVPASVKEDLGDLGTQALIHKEARLLAELADEYRDLAFWCVRDSMPRHALT